MFIARQRGSGTEGLMVRLLVDVIRLVKKPFHLSLELGAWRTVGTVLPAGTGQRIETACTVNLWGKTGTAVVQYIPKRGGSQQAVAGGRIH